MGMCTEETLTLALYTSIPGCWAHNQCMVVMQYAQCVQYFTWGLMKVLSVGSDYVCCGSQVYDSQSLTGRY